MLHFMEETATALILSVRGDALDDLNSPSEPKQQSYSKFIRHLDSRYDH